MTSENRRPTSVFENIFKKWRLRGVSFVCLTIIKNHRKTGKDKLLNGWRMMNTRALPLVSLCLLKSWKRTRLDIPQVSHTWIICTRLNTHLVFILSKPFHRCPIKNLQSSVEQHRRFADFAEKLWGMANLAVLKLASQPPLRDVMNPACCGVWRGCAWRGWPVVYTTPYSSQRSLRRGDFFLKCQTFRCEVLDLNKEKQREKVATSYCCLGNF